MVLNEAGALGGDAKRGRGVMEEWSDHYACPAGGSSGSCSPLPVTGRLDRPSGDWLQCSPPGPRD